MTATAEVVRVLVVDDEPPARARLRDLLAAEQGFELVGEAATVDEAVDAVGALDPDLVFLDVQMPGGDGFEVVRRLGADRCPAIVFVTAFDAHALRAFEVHALDYLLKPFDDRRFGRALRHAAEAVRQRRLDGLYGRLKALLRSAPAAPEPTAVDSDARSAPETDRPAPAKLAVRAAGRLRLVAIDDIDWIEAAGTYVRLHTGDRSLLLRQPLSKLERRLASHRFVRIHRSTLVHAGRVREVRSGSHGDAVVVLEDGTELRMSRSHRDRLGQLLEG